MPEAFVLALDQGTTSSRAILFDREGRTRAMAQEALTQHYPKPGWVEHDAAEIWQSQQRVMQEVLRQIDIQAAQLAAIGITNQRETTVLWDRQTGAPIAPAIVWQDRRTAQTCDALRASGLSEEIATRTGLVLDAYFSATKLQWLLDHVPGARKRAERGELAFGTVDTWLVWQLTAGAVHATDPSNASRTMLFDIGRNQWDEALLEHFRIPRQVLPEVRPSAGDFGHAELAGVRVPIAGVAGDQQAALFGQGCHRAGLAKNTYGTGCFLLLNTGTNRVNSKHRMLTTTAWQLKGEPPQYALEGSVFIGGALVQWLRDGLQIISHSAEIESLAASVPDNCGVYLVPAFTGLGAPHWDAYARGAMLGLTRGTSKAHIARAALEAIAFQCAEVLLAMQADAGASLAELRVDGGAACNDLLLQIQSDLLGVPVARPRVLETTALGAAALAGHAVGYWETLAEIAALNRIERVFEPQLPRSETAERLQGWARAVERAKGWESH